MNSTESCRNRLLVWMAALTGAAWPGPVPAEPQQAAAAGAAAGTATAAVPAAALAESPWPESDTVLDLLRADARAAAAGKRLERAQDWLAMPAGTAPTPVSSPVSAFAPPGAAPAQDQLDVIAIYGVGRALHADILINGALWRYRQGRRWPQGIDEAAGEPLYSLMGIEQPCVRLQGQASTRTACLQSKGSGHK